ncbi:hypothetical protein BOTBODRAFT_185816 [Botryobasidium botryosum FD-172 SS1]|uniref:Uncharacterized protein n=1 Tax=Botryobasidium botryosum (strain FD-172 SS1) TaxID=930990 RepID=A0A067N1R9_BOTB1|nr:hypothetical protein BOTBODRAFT_185816 [Botryobasidium botryosum FD-172 SS1]
MHFFSNFHWPKLGQPAPSFYRQHMNELSSHQIPWVLVMKYRAVNLENLVRARDACQDNLRAELARIFNDSFTAYDRAVLSSPKKFSDKLKGIKLRPEAAPQASPLDYEARILAEIREWDNAAYVLCFLWTVTRSFNEARENFRSISKHDRKFLTALMEDVRLLGRAPDLVPATPKPDDHLHVDEMRTYQRDADMSTMINSMLERERAYLIERISHRCLY